MRSRFLTSVVATLVLAAGAATLFGGTTGSASSSQASAPAAASPARPASDKFDSGRAWDHLREFVAMGPRPSGSPQIRQARAYITRQLAAAGLTVQEQSFIAETPKGRVEMMNLVVRIPGRSPDRIVFTGHYDTKNLDTRPFVGASDGASSAAFLIEMARAIKLRPRALTYEFVWLDGEEAFCPGWDDCGTHASPDHTYGSRYYVQAAQKAGAIKSIKANILVDMIGDRDFQVRRELMSSKWLTDIVWTTAKRLGYDKVFLPTETSVEDDHIPFLNAGVPSLDIIDFDYPQWHTPEDDLAHVGARGMQIVGDVLLAALPEIEKR